MADTSGDSAVTDTVSRLTRLKALFNSQTIAVISSKLKILSYQFQRLVITNKEIKALIVWLIFVVGCFIADFFPLPPSYLSSKKNIFNVYFVKKGWGWTCGLLSVFIYTMLISYKVHHKGRIVKHLGRLILATVTWFMMITLFDVVESEYFTGACLNSKANTKSACIKLGSRWEAFDISGHAFLLSFCILVINEELQGIAHWRHWIQESHENSLKEKDKKVVHDENKTDILSRIEIQDILAISINILSVLLTALMVLWEFMLFCTCVYFHSFAQKLSGIMFGLGSWYCLYHIIFKLDKQFIPCFPILTHNRSSSKHM